MEMSLGCDNLLCDALGRAPSCRLVVWVRNESEETAMTASSVSSSSSNSLETMWRKYCQTEVVEKSSNPSFMRTTVFRESDGVDDKLCRIKVSAHDMRERFTSTTTLLGTATTSFQELKTKGPFSSIVSAAVARFHKRFGCFSGRLRLKLDSPNPEGRSAGFVSMTGWGFDPRVPSSTDSTPVHKPNSHNNMKSSESNQEIKRTDRCDRDATRQRSHSLPPSIRHR